MTMALIGISLIFASVILFCIRRPAWFSSLFESVPPRQQLPSPPSISPLEEDSSERKDEKPSAPVVAAASAKSASDRAAMPPPPPSFAVIQPESDISDERDEAEQTTPKASAASLATPVPAFSLSAPAPSIPSTSPSSLMPPPPRPPALRPTGPSSLSPAATSRLSPAPARGPGCSTLAPPPTHSSKPAKPSRAVILKPGHSPLDWARLSGSPTADLRGLPPGTPYLRVPPSLLKKYTGRKGKDAWTVLNGKVYNLSPYMPFHPGGEPELLRCAGRDGTKLFGEIHPWVNYEGMLAACLIGIFVTEEEEEEAMARAAAAAAAAGASSRGDMEAMD